MKITKFEELDIWKISLNITKEIYDITSNGAIARDYGLKDQIRRAVVSISSNIVEGFEKANNNEFARYLRIAKGSAGECRNQLYIAATIGYVNKTDHVRLDGKLNLLANKIGALISYLVRAKKLKHVTRNP